MTYRKFNTTHVLSGSQLPRAGLAVAALAGCLAVLCARPAVGSDPFAVLLADDFITPAPGAANATAALCAAYAASGRSQILLQDVPASQAYRYGIAIPGSGPGCVAGLIEKTRAG